MGRRFSAEIDIHIKISLKMIYLASMLMRKISDLLFDLPGSQTPGRGSGSLVSLHKLLFLWEYVALAENKHLDKEKSSETYPRPNWNWSNESGTTNHYTRNILFRKCWENWLPIWEKLFKPNFKKTMRYQYPSVRPVSQGTWKRVFTAMLFIVLGSRRQHELPLLKKRTDATDYT